MHSTAIIGGTGLTRIEGLQITRREMVRTPWGAPSGPVIHGELFGRPVIFLARHGHGHTIPPHRINYQANIWALREAGAARVVAVAAVGATVASNRPLPSLVVPDQLIDYTWGRAHTYFDGAPERVEHIDFTDPYDVALREALIGAAESAGVAIEERGCYGVCQGPRVPTAAEVRRMAADGCTLVGMTGMPEAALARELQLAYASLAVVVDVAGQHREGAQSAEERVANGVEQVRALIGALLAA